MIMKSNSMFIEEIDTLEEAFDIDTNDANEILNIYFECCSNMSYDDFLNRNITILKDIKENQVIIDILKQHDDACLFESDRDTNRYYILTNSIDMERIIGQKEFQNKTLLELFNEREDLKEEHDRYEEEYANYSRRVDEFYECGYNEEDEDFHGMILYQNSIWDKMNNISEKIDKIQRELESRMWYRMTDDEVEKFNDEYCFEL